MLLVVQSTVDISSVETSPLKRFEDYANYYAVGVYYY
jgi:hypothetical protein